MKFILIILSLISYSTNAAELLDILTNSSSTFEEREVVANDLQELLGMEQPLPILDAVAEICYGVDICAIASKDDEIERLCNPRDFDDAEFSPHFGTACYLKKFKQSYSCNKSITQMNFAGLQAFSN